MMMPIVSMNKMAMNESIAVTCCYREVATPTAVYWEVMNGGWIGSGYVNTTGWYDNFEAAVSGKVWQKYEWDINGAGGNDLNALINGVRPEYGDYTTFGGEAKTGWFVPDSVNGVGSMDAANATAANEGWTRGKSCTHVDGTCNYRYDENAYAQNQHWNATTAHGGITAWSAPHGAARYNS